MWHFWLQIDEKLTENWEYEAQNGQLSRRSKVDKIANFSEYVIIKIWCFDTILLFQIKNIFVFMDY